MNRAIGAIVGLITGMALLLAVSIAQSEVLIVMINFICCVLFGSIFVITSYSYRFSKNAVFKLTGLANLLMMLALFVFTFLLLYRGFWTGITQVSLALCHYILGFSLVIVYTLYSKDLSRRKRGTSIILCTALPLFYFLGLYFSGISLTVFFLHSLAVAALGSFLSIRILFNTTLSIGQESVRNLRWAYGCLLLYFLCLSLTISFSSLLYVASAIELAVACFFYRGLILANVNQPYHTLYRRLTGLNHELSQNALELDTIREELKLVTEKFVQFEQLSIMGELAAVVSHEVKNPLTSVRGFLQLFIENEELAKYKSQWEMMLREIDRATYIIVEYLRIGRNNITETMERQDISAIIRQQSCLLECDARCNNKLLNLELQSVSDIIAYERSLVQLFINLSRNAFEAMQEGGCLTIKTYEEDGCVVASFQDEGCGFSAEKLSQLKKPFVTTKDKGTGLGLPVCYEVAEKHHADIRVESGQQGTCFRIYFPPAPTARSES